MKIVNSVKDMQDEAKRLRASGKSIGFVPTMGALHEGHLSLLTIARAQCDVLVSSIFVNPSQFGPKEDLAKYPRPFDHDRALCEKEGVDILFAPDAPDMYPASFSTWVTVEKVTDPLEGALRPGHFRGVSTIVLKLFNCVLPTFAVFGQKDAQQVAVIRRMVRDLNIPVEIIVAPIVREADGLAKSSRNIFLTEKERSAVPLILRGLLAADRLFENGEIDAAVLRRRVEHELATSPWLSPDYVSLTDPDTLEPCEVVSRGTLLSVAVKTLESGTRLLDNVILGMRNPA